MKMTSNNYIYCRNGCGQLIKLGNASLTGKKILLGENGIPHNCLNRPAIDKQESELRKYPVTFERASDLRDRELIERSYVQIDEINRLLMHCRLEIIVMPKGQTRGDASNHDVSGQFHHCSEWPGKANLETAK
jgi:hypothetical protein